MIKSVVKILIAIAIANALWRVSSSYISYYRFKDSVDDLAIHSGGRTDPQLRDRVVELAGMYDEPVDPEAIDIRRNEQHLVIAASYTKPVSLFPGYEYQWPFRMNVDAVVIGPARFGDLSNPK
jgi:hypothetical protein